MTVADEVRQLAQQGQQLMADRRYGEAAELFGKLLDRFDTTGDVELQLHADVARLRGTALRYAGDLPGSTRSLQLAVSLLESASRTPEQTYVLGAALRALVLNSSMAADQAGAKSASARLRSVVEELLPSLPAPAADLLLAQSEDLASAGAADWIEPVEWLLRRAASLDPASALAVLKRLHDYWQARGDRPRATRMLEAAVTRVEALDPADLSENLAQAHNLAWAALQSGSPELARRVYQRVSALPGAPPPRDAWEWRRLAVSLSPPDSAPALIAQRRTLHEDAKRDFGPADQRTVTAQRELADALVGDAQHAEAVKSYQDVFAAELKARRYLTAADVASDLGHTLDAAHRYSEAADAHRQAYRIRSRLLGPEDERTNSSCYEVAELSRVLRRYDEAEHYFLSAMEVDDAAGRRDPDRSARIRNNLAEVYVALARYDDARPLLDEALAIRERHHGPSSDQAWRSQAAIARLLLSSGDAAGALTLAREGLEHVDEAKQSVWYIVQAGALLATGDVEGAEPIYQTVVEQVPLSELDRGITLDVYLEVLEGLTRCRMARAAWPEAAESAGRVLEVARLTFTSLLQEGSETQVAHTLRPLLGLQSLWLTALWRAGISTGSDVSNAFEMVELTKGLRTRYVRLRQPGVPNVEQILPPQKQKALEETTSRIRKLTDELTAEYLALGDAKAFARSREAIANRAKLRELERTLATATGDWELYLDQAPVLSGSFLPEGSVGLEIVLVRDLGAARGNGEANPDRYLAFAIGPDRVPGLHDIGLAEEIDRAIGEMRVSIMSDRATPQSAWKRLSAYLGRKVLRACWPRLREARHLAVAPDGAFGAVPLELLTTPEGRYLLDHCSVSYGIRLAELAQRTEVFRKGGPPLVLAGPDFDLPDAFTGPRLSLGATRSLRALAGATRFQPLKASREEGLAVARLLGTEALTDVWALAAELLGNRSPEILLISTHGFVLPSQGLQNDPLSLAGRIGNDLDKRMVLDDSLQRSGLALAGINALLDGRSIPAAAGTGVVYASDIQQLSLQQTDLVVLGACRSGLGEIAPADGAHGLRRAFLAAGCRSVVSSLWDVPDESSRQLLEAFIERALAGKSRLDALAEARRLVRDLHPDDPVHWAGFVLDGVTEPLWRHSAIADLRVASVSFRAWGIGSATDATAMGALAQRLVHGDPDQAMTVSIARQGLAGTDLTDDDRVWLLQWRGDLANHLGDHAQAIADYEAILTLRPDPPLDRAAIQYNIAKIRWQAGEYDAAIAGYTDALAEASTAKLRSVLRVNRGVAYMQRGDTAAAVADMNAVIDDSEAPIDQQWMAYTNRAGLTRDTDPEGALRDLAISETLGVASEEDALRMRALRVEILLRLGRSQEVLAESAELLANPQLSEELREFLTRWAEQASATAVSRA